MHHLLKHGRKSVVNRVHYEYLDCRLAAGRRRRLGSRWRKYRPFSGRGAACGHYLPVAVLKYSP
jgi:hypothetical protein